MPEISLLKNEVINKIAAGEVVERPASVVKELVENSLDAGALQINISLQNGGIDAIKVEDFGAGIKAQQLKLAVTRHATSKLREAEDLYTIGSLGFRGEALASIASVSRFSIASRVDDQEDGARLSLEGGEQMQSRPYNGAVGTTIEVQDLFFNIPARRKFLKSSASELAAVVEWLQSLALTRPDVGFKLSYNGKEKFDLKAFPAAFDESHDRNLPSEAALRGRIAELYGKELSEKLLLADCEQEHGRFFALISPPGLEKASSKNMLFFVNGRAIKDKSFRYATMRGYQTHLLKGRFPQVFGFFVCDRALVDVNVSPDKTEVKFQYAPEVSGLLATTIRRCIREGSWALELRSTNEIDWQNDPELTAPKESPSLDPHDRFSAQKASLSAGAKSSDLPGGAVKHVLKNHSVVRNQSSTNSVEGDCGRSFVRPVSESCVDSEVKPLGFSSEPKHASGMLSFDQARTITVGNQSILFEELEWIGNFNNCYLLFQWQNKLLAIDQHAFHERILFEKLKNRDPSTLGCCKLMIPEVLEFSPEEMVCIKEKQQDLALFGFEVLIISDQVLEVLAVPALFSGKNFSELILDICRQDKVHTSEHGGGALSSVDLVLATVACHSAVRAGDSLDQSDWKSLMKEATHVDFSLNCPHGRRVFKWFHDKEVAQWFDRT